MQVTEEKSADLQGSIYSVCGELLMQQISRDEATSALSGLIDRELEKRGWKVCHKCYNRGYSVDTKRKTHRFTICDCGRGVQLQHWISEFYISRDELVKFARGN